MNVGSLLARLAKLDWAFSKPVHLGEDEAAPSICMSEVGGPEGVTRASPGSLCLCVDGTTYRKESGLDEFGWVEFGAGGGGGGGGVAVGGALNSTQYHAAGSLLGGAGPGNAGQVLVSQGADDPPTFEDTATFTPFTTDVRPAITNPADDEFDHGAVLDVVGDRVSGATPWAWRNRGAADATLSNGSLILTLPPTTGDNFRIVEQAVAPGAWKYRMKISAIRWPHGAYGNMGIAAINSVNESFHGFFVTTNGAWGLSASYWADVNTYGGVSSGFGANPYFDVSNGTPTQSFPIYLELESDGTTLFFRVSMSGLDGTFYLCGSQTIGDYLLNVDRIGIAFNYSATAEVVSAVNWFRRVA